MKKKLIIAAFASVVVGTASAQTAPEPPKPPKAQVEKTADIPPPPAPEPPLPPKPPSNHITAVVPPPPPSEPPPPTEPPSPPMPPVMMEEGIPGFEDYEAFLKRNPSVKSLGWTTTTSEIIIKLKSGKQERYSLDDEKSIKDAEAKYGKLPEVPPAPPPPPPPMPSKSKRTLS